MTASCPHSQKFFLTALSWRRTDLISSLMVGVKASHSLGRSPAPLKHQRRIPPLLNILNKSNIVLSLQTTSER